MTENRKQELRTRVRRAYLNLLTTGNGTLSLIGLDDEERAFALALAADYVGCRPPNEPQ